MISMKMNNYNEKQANLLLELLNTAFETIQDEYCAATDLLTIEQENACQICPVRVLCKDLDSTIDYLTDWTVLKAANRQLKIAKTLKK